MKIETVTEALIFKISGEKNEKTTKMKESNSNAQALVGYTFEKGWKVLSEHSRFGTATGGIYSICLDVEKDGIEYFMKALDYDAHLRKRDVAGNPTKALNLMTAQHLYECKLCEICRNGNITKVVHVIDTGTEFVDRLNVQVPYLVFEKADMDAHEFLDLSDRMDFVWKLHSLHEVALGLYQLHQVSITHQDVKPSNILIFGKESKLGDLGRSFSEEIKSPFEEDQFPGDQNYFPPEKRYNRQVEKSWEQRCLTDCYLLGSLLTYYLTRETMNAIMDRHMPPSMHPTVFNGKWEEVEGPIKNAFHEALCEIEAAIPFKRKDSKDEGCFRDRLISVVKQLCYPLYEKRGFMRESKKSQRKYYQTQRALSEFALLVYKAESLSLR